jgi:hypothetical protein
VGDGEMFFQGDGTHGALRRWAAPTYDQIRSRPQA